MSREQRTIALGKLSQLASSEALMTIIGGEPTLRPDFLIEAVSDVKQAGFIVSVVSNGWGMTPELVSRLSGAGLDYLAISVDCDNGAEKSNLPKALTSLAVARQQGIVPVINTVITRNTKADNLKEFTNTIIGEDCFLSPIVCSPAAPSGAFSNASGDAVPTREQLRSIIPWLAWKKLTTGMIATSFASLWRAFQSYGTDVEGNVHLWHCASHFRTAEANGRGYLTLDSDGYIGPCQEYPRVTNTLDIPAERLSLHLLDEMFSEVTRRCSGCTYSCYSNEEDVRGLTVIPEVTTAIQIANVLTRKSR